MSVFLHTHTYIQKQKEKQNECSLTHSLTHSHTHTLTHSLTHTHTHSHTHSHTLSLTLSLVAVCSDGAAHQKAQLWEAALRHHTTAALLPDHAGSKHGIAVCIAHFLDAVYRPPQAPHTPHTPVDEHLQAAISSSAPTRDARALLTCPLSGDTLHKPTTHHTGVSVSKLSLAAAPALVHTEPFFPQRHWDVSEPAVDVVLSSVTETLFPT